MTVVLIVASFLAGGLLGAVVGSIIFCRGLVGTRAAWIAVGSLVGLVVLVALVTRDPVASGSTINGFALGLYVVRNRIHRPPNNE